MERRGSCSKRSTIEAGYLRGSIAETQIAEINHADKCG